tara:strand:+ start:454 stop:744 length:291 start_codon:yes stop_codon:yes gene_type:complete
LIINIKYKKENNKTSNLLIFKMKFFTLKKLFLLKRKNKRKNKIIEELVIIVYEILLVKFRLCFVMGKLNIIYKAGNEKIIQIKNIAINVLNDSFLK